MDAPAAAPKASHAAIVLAALSFFTCWMPGLGLALSISAIVAAASRKRPIAASTAAVILAGVGLLGSLGATAAAIQRMLGGTAERPAARAPALLPVETPAPTPEEPELAISAAKLLADYHNNEVSADAAYKGRRVRLAGVAINVSKDAFGVAHVNVGTGALFEFPHVVCDVSGQEIEKAAQINKGDRILLTGRVSGMIVGLVGVADTVIVSLRR